MEQVALESKTMNRVHIQVVLDVFAKLRKVILLVSPSLSVRPREITRLPLEVLPLKLIFKYFWKICRENLSVINIGEE